MLRHMCMSGQSAGAQVRMQHETYPSSYEQSSRLVVLVGDVEVRDRLTDSHINKLLYQYTTEAMPKQAHASMVRKPSLCTCRGRGDYSHTILLCRSLSKCCLHSQKCTVSRNLRRHLCTCQCFRFV